MLEKILDNQNPFWRFMSKMFDVAVLNIVWTLVCLPLITIGSATTALFAACFQMIRDNTAGVLKCYWSSFKMNFRQATVLWLGGFAVVGMLVFDLWYFTVAQNYLNDTAVVLIGGLLAIVLVLVLAVAVMAFALLSLFENTVKQTLTNAVILVLRHPARALGAVLMDVAMVGLGIFALLKAPMLSIVLTLFGGGLAVFFNAVLLFPLFRASLPADESEAEEMTQEEA